MSAQPIYDFSELDDAKLYRITYNELYKSFSNIKCNEMLLHLLYSESIDRESFFYELALKDAQKMSSAIQTINQKTNLNVIPKKEIFDNFAQYNQNELIESTLNADQIDNDIYKKLKLDRNNFIMIEVSGESMRDANLNDGDLLMVDIYSKASNGSIIVAKINGNLFVKRYKIIDNQSWLFSDNPEFEPYKITSDHDFSIFGVVKNIIKKIE